MNCPFKVDVPLALGKVVLCHVCDLPFTMNEYSVKLAKPHCTSCGKIQVKDASGKRKFVSKNRMGVIASEVAQSSADNMKQRLGVVMDKQPDEDI